MWLFVLCCLFDGLDLGAVFNVVIISLHDVPETFVSVFQTVFLAIVNDDILNKREFIEGNSGEDMMLNLVLHTSANVVEEPVLEVNVSGGDDLMGEVVVDLVSGFGLVSLSELLLSFILEFGLVTGSDDESGDGTCDEDTQGPDLPRQEAEVPDPVDGQANHFFIVSAVDGPEDGINLPFNLKDAIQCGEIDVLNASVPGVLRLLGGPEIDEGEELNITIVLSFVGTQMVTIVLGGPPIGGKTIADGSINQVNVSHDVISLVITLVTNPTADEGTETEAEGRENGVGLAVPGCQEEQGNSVEDLDKFNNVVSLEEIALLKLEHELQVISLGDLVFFSDVG